MNVVSPPLSEPVSLVEARLQCSIDCDLVEGSPPTPSFSGDPLLTIYISMAREWCEKYIGAAIAPQTVEVAMDSFPLAGTTVSGTLASVRDSSTDLTIAYSPILGIESIRYIDSDTLALLEVDPSTYSLNTDRYPARVILGTDQVWPSAAVAASAVRVRYIVGYSTPGASPQDAPLPVSIKGAIMMLVAHLWRNREATAAVALQNVPYGVRSFLAPYKLQFPIA